MKKNLLFTFVLLISKMVSAATFSSVSSGTWSAPATWSFTGTDADGIPDSDDDVTIVSSHSITLTSASNFKTLTIQASAILNGNGQTLRSYGDVNNNGTLTGTITYLVMAPTVFYSSTSINAPGNWYTYANFTIAAGTTINKQNYIYANNSSIITNLGSVKMSGGSVTLYSSSSWINGVNSSLEISAALGGNLNFNFTATGNTIIYNSVSTILSKTYYNLTLSGGGNKILQGNTVVTNNLTLSSSGGNVLNCNNFNLTVGGNWINNANTTCINQGVITFNGSGTQTISRPAGQETINNMVVAGTGTVLLASTLNTTTLTINSGTFDVNSTNQIVFLRGDLTNNSVLNCRAGTINLSGTTLQSIGGTSNTQFYNLTLNNNAGCIINSNQSLTNALTLTTGNFNSNNNFTLISNASQTARIAPKGAGSPSFSGNMIIQKFISGRSESWHDLSSPVVSSTIMDWDDEMYMSGIGTYDGIAGPAGVDGSAGGFISVYTWVESTASYSAVSGSSTPLVSGKGYEIWLADDQSAWNAKVINTVGVPTFGDKTINLSYTAGAGAYAGVNLVGNPFASSINYASCTKTNVTGNILILDNSGNYTDYGSNPVIPPHQGFWITASGAGASLRVNETAKSTSTTTTFFRTAPNYGIKMVFSSPNLPFYNENTINFEYGTSENYDIDYDALYLRSPAKNAPSMFMYADGNAKLITNTISSDKPDISIPLGFYTPVGGTYYIEPAVLNTGNYNYAWIENTKTGKKYNLNTSIPIESNADEINSDYVLRLSKEPQSSLASQSVLENDLTIFNTEDQVNVKAFNTDHKISNISLYDVSGKLLLTQDNITLNAGKTTSIDISSLAKGIYIIQITDNTNHSVSKKILR